eukprot:TRINITY_DN1681_c0_g1_i3.p1 TRINITY_DN1681_c0_g1~~TRINITY_DN1681_c0_g1_i3.p1  ORF type:complete len:185 (-),score=7.98 TRINITY_DN1681_c0_g1_i3:140-694(-)
MQTSVFFAAKPIPISIPIGVVKSQYKSPSTLNDPPLKASESTMATKWSQKTVLLPPHNRGCHLVTPKILREIEQDLSGFKCGLAHFFLQHKSASLTIDENYDSDVRDDTETFLKRGGLQLGSIKWKAPMTCRHTLNHQCLVATSRFQLLTDVSIWALGRGYGFVSTGTMLLHAMLWLHLMECKL